MEYKARLNRFALIMLMMAATALAGCSGSSGASSAGADLDDQTPPAGQPPADDPPADDPDDPPGDGSAEPEVTLSAAESVVPAGDSVVLSWSSANTTSCTASGGWNGARSLQGSVSVGPLTQGTTFSLTCSGPGGNAIAMLSVSVLGVVTLEWEPPTENVDGTPLDDLAGYRIYYGELSRSYSDEVAVADEASTAHEVTLPSGSYYFAMTALDSEGNESAYSNEVVKVVN